MWAFRNVFSNAKCCKSKKKSPFWVFASNHFRFGYLGIYTTFSDFHASATWWNGYHCWFWSSRSGFNSQCRLPSFFFFFSVFFIYLHIFATPLFCLQNNLNLGAWNWKQTRKWCETFKHEGWYLKYLFFSKSHSSIKTIIIIIRLRGTP